ncbi:MAG: hypothetical protein LC739_14470, partial [Actinobacteria bacterium]|nr:hypothetical protein [Actinomycetota bacterium]
MRRWAVRGSLVLIGVFGLMLMPSVALADNCSGGRLLDCWGSASRGGGRRGTCRGRLFPTAGDSSQRGPNDPRGGASDPLRDLMNDLDNADRVANAP